MEDNWVVDLRVEEAVQMEVVLKGTSDIFLKFFIVKIIFCMCNVTDSCFLQGNSCINTKGDETCEKLKKRGFCKNINSKRGSWMVKICKKACNWCQTSSSYG